MKKRLSARVTNAVNWRVDERVNERVDGRLTERLAGTLDEAVLRLQEPLVEWLHALNRRLDELQDEYMFARSEIDRLAPQVAALERRIEDLRLALVDLRAGGDAGLADDVSRNLLEEARLEHERARIRLEIASHYEERLRRLEDPAR